MDKLATGATTSLTKRIKIDVQGAVQGIGFRPFVYRLATDLGISGSVVNTVAGVTIEAQAKDELLQAFIERLQLDKPALSFLDSIMTREISPISDTGFVIKTSSTIGFKTSLILPDIATCEDCRREIFDPEDRRYHYPFTNCTNCGPRLSIIQGLPYDRPNTSMTGFQMCPKCREEYQNPDDRRFHAQPNACPQCGPQIEVRNPAGESVAGPENAISLIADAILSGKIVAVKGLGGFHLMANAFNPATVAELRRRKQREEKPFALMFPDFDSIDTICFVNQQEERMLRSPQAPIVLLRKKAPDSLKKSVYQIAENVAPGNPYIGALLPYTPLHHLLMRAIGQPVVATSGNLSDEPICIDEHEALQRLGAIADLFLVHDRPIVRQVDDSIVQIMAGEPAIHRRARGYAPLPINLPITTGDVLAVGGHLKNTAAFAKGENVFVSQHIGDLSTRPAFDAFRKTVEDFSVMYDFRPEMVVSDLHPDYLSTAFAKQQEVALKQVQHHHAHILAAMAENHLQGPVLGICWDGSGYGPDGTVWGGEFLTVDSRGYQRMAHLRTFLLPGGGAAVREPRRSALGLLYEVYGDEIFDSDELRRLLAFEDDQLPLLRKMLKKGINAPRTSSAGRLFDGVASLLNLCQKNNFEGQAAMSLEHQLATPRDDKSYPFQLRKDGAEPVVADWAPMIKALLKDIGKNCPAAFISAKFHHTLIEMICAVARLGREEKVVLSGGCFQNRYLLEGAILRLRREGLAPYWHHAVPANDGGLSLGQIYGQILSRNK